MWIESSPWPFIVGTALLALPICAVVFAALFALLFTSSHHHPPPAVDSSDMTTTAPSSAEGVGMKVQFGKEEPSLRTTGGTEEKGGEGVEDKERKEYAGERRGGGGGGEGAGEGGEGVTGAEGGVSPTQYEVTTPHHHSLTH
jgi:hypothetical protein